VSLGEGLEGSSDFVVELDVQDALEVLLRLARHLELHAGDLGDQRTHVRRDGSPSDLVLTRGLGDGLLTHLVEANDNLHHANGLGQWAHEVVVGEAVLLQEVLG